MGDLIIGPATGPGGAPWAVRVDAEVHGIEVSHMMLAPGAAYCAVDGTLRVEVLRVPGGWFTRISCQQASEEDLERASRTGLDYMGCPGGEKPAIDRAPSGHGWSITVSCLHREDGPPVS